MNVSFVTLPETYLSKLRGVNQTCIVCCPNNVDSLPELMSTNCPNWGGNCPLTPIPYAYGCIHLTELRSQIYFCKKLFSLCQVQHATKFHIFHTKWWITLADYPLRLYFICSIALDVRNKDDGDDKQKCHPHI